MLCTPIVPRCPGRGSLLHPVLGLLHGHLIFILLNSYLLHNLLVVDFLFVLIIIQNDIRLDEFDSSLFLIFITLAIDAYDLGFNRLHADGILIVIEARVCIDRLHVLGCCPFHFRHWLLHIATAVILLLNCGEVLCLFVCSCTVVVVVWNIHSWRFDILLLRRRSRSVVVVGNCLRRPLVIGRANYLDAILSWHRGCTRLIRLNRPLLLMDIITKARIVIAVAGNSSSSVVQEASLRISIDTDCRRGPAIVETIPITDWRWLLVSHRTLLTLLRFLIIRTLECIGPIMNVRINDIRRSRQFPSTATTGQLQLLLLLQHQQRILIAAAVPRPELQNGRVGQKF